jgi:tRNA-Thr(GGU) m(6)t(6)A37 methyltransferase TsaA
MEPIGFLESCFKDKFGTPRQPGLVKQARARLKIRADLQPEEALQGLEGFSHIWLIWVFHQNKVARYHSKVHPPRLGGKSMGVFATRSPHRPNPIGLSLVELIKVESDGVVVAGCDLVDGTPILDIKPYLPQVEALPEAKVGWTQEVQAEKIEVTFSDQARAQMTDWQSRHPEISLWDIVIDTLKLDPRPIIYRGYESGESPYRSEHAVRLFDGDVHFRFETAHRVLVLNILYMNN